MRRGAIGLGLALATGGVALSASASGWPMTGHMAGHMMLVAVAAPVLAWGLAGRVSFGSPLAMSVVELVAVWGWHLPGMRRWADAFAPAMAVEQVTFLAAGVALWAPALARPAAGVGALLLTSMHMTLLGALIGLAPRPLFHLHGRGVDALADQQLGGVVMLVVGGTAYLLGGLALLGGLLRQREVLA